MHEYTLSTCACCREDDWVAEDTRLCFKCREAMKEDRPMDAPLAIVHDAEFERDITPHAEAAAEYTSSDARMYQINDATDYAEAADIVNELKRRQKDVEASKKSLTDPINLALNRIRAGFKPVEAQLEEAARLWDGKIKAYLLKQQAEQAEVQRRLQEAAQAEDKPAMRTELAKLAPAPVAAGISVRNVWKFELKNIELVPREYLMLNETLVRATMRSQGDEPSIPGIRFYQEQTIARTGK